MNVDELWWLIEASGGSGVVRSEREAFLRERLWRAPRSHLLDFVQHLSATREPANVPLESIEIADRYPRLWTMFGDHWRP